ncbi:hypothetical protein OAT16_04980 [Prolixibacteraceae bacterium]|nr:hypothetical protein [Prolixibacteraceae bacterium]
MAGNYLRLIIISFATLFISCSKENNTSTTPTGIYTNGVYILNEGPWQDPNSSSLFFYNPESNEVESNVFKEVNKNIGNDGLILGALPQSMTKEGDLIHIVINEDNKIFTINAHTAEYLGKITGLTSPRYMVTTPDHRAYVTSLEETKISIVDLVQEEFDTGSVLNKIDILNPLSSEFKQHTSERIIAVGDELFTNSWSNDNKILVIDPNTNKLKDSIEVGIQPQSMVLDKNKKLWVLCDGGYQTSPYGYTNGSIYRINTKDHTVEWHYTFPNTIPKRNICINGTGDTLYFIYTDIYRMKIGETEPSKVIEVQNQQTFYSLGIDPKNGDIYVGDAVDYKQAGMVYRFDKDFNKIDEFRVGILPNSFLFNYN